MALRHERSNSPPNAITCAILPNITSISLDAFVSDKLAKSCKVVSDAGNRLDISIIKGRHEDNR